ncbi:MAG: hypothetical protein OXT67_01825 [Zetaproteobacteria bacterium]|nr:hypothetical protein [Zetaproteobacteria bacterium]
MPHLHSDRTDQHAKVYPFYQRALYVAGVILACRTLSGVFAAFTPLEHPHIWRQTDTLGVTLRFWSRWTLEPATATPWFIPAVLNSGDHGGYMPMEAPFLNLLLAPCFAAGPTYGVPLARLCILMLHLCAWWGILAAWRNKTILGLPARSAFFFLPAVGMGSLYFTKFIPDVLANALALIAVGLAWQRTHMLSAFLLATVALLSKPTAGITFLLCLLHPQGIRGMLAMTQWGIPATLLGILYYTFGTEWMRETFTDTAELFKIAPKPLIQGMGEFFSQPLLAFNLIANDFLFPGGLFATALLAIVSWQSHHMPLRPFLSLGAVLSLQICCIAALDGEHSFGHTYYYLGVMPTLTLMLTHILRAVSTVNAHAHANKFFILFCLLWVGANINTIATEISAYIPALQRGRLAQKECSQLIHAHPQLPWQQGFTFRSDFERYPSLGLCFGERQNSQLAEYGFYWKQSRLPPGCYTLDTSPHLRLIHCPPATTIGQLPQ